MGGEDYEARQVPLWWRRSRIPGEIEGARMRGTGVMVARLARGFADDIACRGDKGVRRSCRPRVAVVKSSERGEGDDLSSGRRLDGAGDRRVAAERHVRPATMNSVPCVRGASMSPRIRESRHHRRASRPQRPAVAGAERAVARCTRGCSERRRRPQGLDVGVHAERQRGAREALHVQRSGRGRRVVPASARRGP
jgi:hypothetical protein